MAKSDSPPDLGTAIVLVTYNGGSWLRQSLLRLAGKDALAIPGTRLPILVVDNASTDAPVQLISDEFPRARLIRCERNTGFAGAANVGLHESDAEVVVLLNPDVAVTNGTIAALQHAFLTDGKLAIVGGKLLYPGGKTIQHAGGQITYPLALAEHYGYGELDRGQCDEPREVDYVTGALFAVRKSVLKEIGHFDEGFFPAYFEETDLCYRARRAGYKVLYVPEAVAIHHESATTGKNTPQYYHLYHRNRVRFVLKHYSEQRLIDDFWPAEQERLAGLGAVEVEALSEAYGDNLAVLQGRATFFANPAAVSTLSTSRGRERTLETLLDEARRRRERLKLARSQDSAGGAASQAIERLATRSVIAEPPFASSAPFVGGALVRVRRMWNWMSTKWYVRPIIQQQSEFNYLTVEALRELEDKLATWETALVDLQRTAQRLTRDIALLESHLQRLEDRLSPPQDSAAEPTSPPEASPPSDER